MASNGRERNNKLQCLSQQTTTIAILKHKTATTTTTTTTKCHVIYKPDEDVSMWSDNHNMDGRTEQMWCGRRQDDRRAKTTTACTRKDVETSVLTSCTD